MARQISGSDKTLVDAINDGDIDKPNLMSWNAWQQWRSRGGGRRPTQERDGFSTTSTQEVAWYREVMAEQYGTSWAEDILVAEAEAEAAAASSARGSGLPPSGAPGHETPRASQEDSPESGGATGVRSPGSGQQTPSWRSSNPGSPGTIRQFVLGEYNPAKEPIEKYLSRLDRQAQARIV